MRTHQVFLLPLFLSLIFSLHAQESILQDLLPKPQKATAGTGYFSISDQTVFVKSDAYNSFFQQFLQEKQGIKTKNRTKTPKNSYVAYQISRENMPDDEAYSLDINPERILVRARSAAGFFYADQTLIQLSRLAAETGQTAAIPAARIEDAPRFAWRGMHLDESRHFFGKTFVKSFIDQLAGLKMNVFHWHLTDAPGWRIEIKKYPKLTSLAAWRPDRSGISFEDADTARTGEAMNYGGFYTQAEIREIVAYAAARHITILPEIEMPGHTTAALAAYPEFSCTGGPFPVPGGAKNCPYPNFCVGNEATIRFLTDVLSEVIDLFPSAYIHIGGDEVERNQWHSCPRCQAYMKTKGIADEASLQVDFTKRIEDFLRSKGRKLMGWDEIMEGGNLSQSAGVMVWRGENLVNEATAAGHEVVVTHAYYFNQYQGMPQYEPEAGGYKTLADAYNYEPVPAALNAEQRRLVRGVQGCLWSEYLYAAKNVEYMMFPRTFALAETAWSPAEQKNWSDFARRIPLYLKMWSRAGVNVSRSVFTPYPQMRFDSAEHGVICVFEQQIPKGDVRYTLDGSRPTLRSELYTRPLKLDKPCLVQAAAFEDEQEIGSMVKLQFTPSLSSGKPFTLKHLPKPQYNGRRPEALSDGIRGSNNFHDGNWCGFYGDDIDLNIDLLKIQPLQSIRLNLMETVNSWIYLPRSLRMEISEDNQHWETVFQADAAALAAITPQRIKTVELRVSGKKARFVHIFAENRGDHPIYKGEKCWLFLDEVEIK